MRLRDENKVQAISEMAIAMIAEEGLENFSINRLAKAANVSPATIYIYYKDKDDLINQLSVEQGMEMVKATVKGLSPDMPFEDGLWLQWKNRAHYAINNKQVTTFLAQLRNSNYRATMMNVISEEMKNTAGKFVKNAIKRGEVDDISIEVFWSVAFAPLYSLLKFHLDGESLGGKKFTLTPKIMRGSFSYVIKALSK